MTRIILTTGELAKKPYRIRRMERNIWSVEELCYSLLQSAQFLDSEIMDPVLVQWLREECGLPDLAERLIIINGVSKAYAMTGYRIGWLMSKNEAFVSACIRLQGQQVTCATMVAQKAAEAALTGTQECVEEMRDIFASRRKLICSLAAEIPGMKFHEPQGAFYLFPDVSAWGTGNEVAERLLEEAHVAVVSGSAFGCPSCIRLSYAISEEEIRKAMSRIAVLLNNW